MHGVGMVAETAPNSDHWSLGTCHWLLGTDGHWALGSLQRQLAACGLQLRRGLVIIITAPQTKNTNSICSVTGFYLELKLEFRIVRFNSAIE